MKRRTEKVLIFCTRGHELLVFRQPAHPEAGWQVPAGTLEPGEDPRRAAGRELEEESGIQGARAVGARLEYQFHLPPPRDELQHRHVFHFQAPAGLPPEWTWWERHASDGQPPIEFAFRWWPLAGALPALAAGQGRGLAELAQELATPSPPLR